MPELGVVVTGGPGGAGTVVVGGSPSATSGAVGVPTFISATQPDGTGPWLWWDTSTPDITLWINDGEA